MSTALSVDSLVHRLRVNGSAANGLARIAYVMDNIDAVTETVDVETTTTQFVPYVDSNGHLQYREETVTTTSQQTNVLHAGFDFDDLGTAATDFVLSVERELFGSETLFTVDAGPEGLGVVANGGTDIESIGGLAGAVIDRVVDHTVAVNTGEMSLEEFETQFGSEQEVFNAGVDAFFDVSSQVGTTSEASWQLGINSYNGEQRNGAQVGDLSLFGSGEVIYQQFVQHANQQTHNLICNVDDGFGGYNPDAGICQTGD